MNAAPFDESADEGPGEHDAHLQDDDLEETVRCAHCGKAIWAYAQRCPECGVHFEGEAWEFKPAGEAPGAFSRSRLYKLTAIVVLVVILFVWVLHGIPL